MSVRLTGGLRGAGRQGRWRSADGSTICEEAAGRCGRRKAAAGVEWARCILAACCSQPRPHCPSLPAVRRPGWFRPGVGRIPSGCHVHLSGPELGNRDGRCLAGRRFAPCLRRLLSFRATSLAVGADPRRLSHQPLRAVARTADRARRCAAARRDLALRLQASARSPCACVSLVGTHPPPRLLGRPLRAVRPLGCGGPWLRVCACALGSCWRCCWRWRWRSRWRRRLAGANQLVRGGFARRNLHQPLKHLRRPPKLARGGRTSAVVWVERFCQLKVAPLHGGLAGAARQAQAVLRRAARCQGGGGGGRRSQGGRT